VINELLVWRSYKSHMGGRGGLAGRSGSGHRYVVFWGCVGCFNWLLGVFWGCLGVCVWGCLGCVLKLCQNNFNKQTEHIPIRGGGGGIWPILHFMDKNMGTKSREVNQNVFVPRNSLGLLPRVGGGRAAVGRTGEAADLFLGGACRGSTRQLMTIWGGA
jgi:hypothetical protein